jgi:gamma-aminobutyric acid type B receptor
LVSSKQISKTMATKIYILMVVCLLSWCCSVIVEAAKKQYTFGIMPKSVSNTYFFPVRDGCQARSEFYGNVACEWVGPDGPFEDPTGMDQAKHINDIVDMRLNGTKVLDGLAISVVNGDALKEPIRRALDSGMSVICFDSDAPQSDRQAYVGTDNIGKKHPTFYEFGTTQIKDHPN